MSRFSLPQDPVFQQLNASISFDWRLAPYDIEQSRAHAKMLAATTPAGRMMLSRRRMGEASGQRYWWVTLIGVCWDSDRYR